MELNVPQVEELGDDYVIPWGTTVLHSRDHAYIEQPDDSEEDRGETNSSDWSCEDQDFEIEDQSSNIQVEDVTESTSLPCDHTARSFVNVFYESIASLFSNNCTISLNERVTNVMALFHPNAFVTLQGVTYCGHENICKVLTSANGFVFEPKSISAQLTYPNESILIIVTGIARTKKKRRRRVTGDDNDSGIGGIMDTEGVIDDTLEWVWKRFIFSQLFNLVAVNTQTVNTEYLIFNSMIRIFSKAKTRKV